MEVRARRKARAVVVGWGSGNWVGQRWVREGRWYRGACISRCMCCPCSCAHACACVPLHVFLSCTLPPHTFLACHAHFLSAFSVHLPYAQTCLCAAGRRSSGRFAIPPMPSPSTHTSSEHFPSTHLPPTPVVHAAGGQVERPRRDSPDACPHTLPLHTFRPHLLRMPLVGRLSARVTMPMLSRIRLSSSRISENIGRPSGFGCQQRSMRSAYA